MSDQPPVIRVPKPNRSKSYQPHRPVGKNTLLLNQVKHFKEIEKDLAPEHKTGIAHEEIRTEGEAADYIKRMTLKIHELHGKA
jgi:hypothetical protein